MCNRHTQSGLIKNTMRYTIDDFNTISRDGFNYMISDATLDIISALAAQVGAPDYVKTPNFSTYKRSGGSVSNSKHSYMPHSHPNAYYHNHNHTSDENSFDGWREYKGVNMNANRRRRRNKYSQEMNDDDWEDLRTFQSKPKAEISEDKMIEKNYRGVLNRIVAGCDNSQVEDVYNMFKKMHSQTSIAPDAIFFDIATFSKMNADIFAELFYKLVVFESKYNQRNEDDDEDEDYDNAKESVESILRDGLRRFMKEKWQKSFDVVEYIQEDEDYDRFCDVNKVNDIRLNTSRFLGKLFQIMFEKENESFCWVDEICDIWDDIVGKFRDNLKMTGNDDVAFIYCANMLAFIVPISVEFNNTDDSTVWIGEAIDDFARILENDRSVYPSLSRQIVFAIQDARIV